jgi:hypothetical protein
MEAQLKAWASEIDRLVVMTQMTGVRADFDSLMYVSELKVLHAITQVRVDEYKTGASGTLARHQAELEKAWGELASAFRKPMP